MFQSLSGFLARCDFGQRSPELVQGPVSIPVGFSRSLRQYGVSGLRPPLEAVSIPVGFSRSLRLTAWRRGVVQTQTVSIPVGFSRSLRLRENLKSGKLKIEFQSLSGFLARCDFKLNPQFEFEKGSFNPCRVFSLVATTALRKCFPGFCDVSIPVGFSRSLRHHGRCPGEREHEAVSIPVGFSRSLRRPGAGSSGQLTLSFNPCRVFSLVATAGQKWSFYLKILSKSPNFDL